MSPLNRHQQLLHRHNEEQVQAKLRLVAADKKRAGNILRAAAALVSVAVDSKRLADEISVTPWVEILNGDR